MTVRISLTLAILLSVAWLASSGARAQQDERNGRDKQVQTLLTRRGQAALDRAKQLNPTWGEAKEGLQVGLARLGDKSRFRPGERVPLEICIRNVGQQPVTARFTAEFYSNVPTVRDPSGKDVSIEPLDLRGARALYREFLKPGEMVVYPHWGLGIGTTPPVDRKEIWHPFVADPVAGTYSVAQNLDLAVTPEGFDARQRARLSSGLV